MLMWSWPAARKRSKWYVYLRGIDVSYLMSYLPTGSYRREREREGLGTGHSGPLIEKEAFEQRQEGGEGASRAGNCGENVSGRGDGH